MFALKFFALGLADTTDQAHFAFEDVQPTFGSELERRLAGNTAEAATFEIADLYGSQPAEDTADFLLGDDETDFLYGGRRLGAQTEEFEDSSSVEMAGKEDDANNFKEKGRRRATDKSYGGGRRRGYGYSRGGYGGYGRGRRRVFQGHDFEGATENTEFMEGMQEETDRRRAGRGYQGGRRRGYGYGRGYGRRLDGILSEEDRRRIDLPFDHECDEMVGSDDRFDGNTDSHDGTMDGCKRRRTSQGYGGGRRRGYGYGRGYGGYGRGYGYRG